MEIWKKVPSVPDLEASSFGRVRCLGYTASMPKGGSRVYSTAATFGYRVSVSTNYVRRIFRFKGKTHKIASCVCEAFHGPRPRGAVTIHLDEDSENNRPDNLRWGSQKENLNMPKIKEYFRQTCRQRFAN